MHIADASVKSIMHCWTGLQQKHSVSSDVTQSVPTPSKLSAGVSESETGISITAGLVTAVAADRLGSAATQRSRRTTLTGAKQHTVAADIVDRQHKRMTARRTTVATSSPRLAVVSSNHSETENEPANPSDTTSVLSNPSTARNELSSAKTESQNASKTRKMAKVTATSNHSEARTESANLSEPNKSANRKGTRNVAASHREAKNVSSNAGKAKKANPDKTRTASSNPSEAVNESASPVKTKNESPNPRKARSAAKTAVTSNRSVARPVAGKLATSSGAEMEASETKTGAEGYRQKNSRRTTANVSTLIDNNNDFICIAARLLGCTLDNNICHGGQYI